MNPPPRPRLKSLPATSTGPSTAEPAPAGPGSGAPKNVAEGVPSSVRPAPHTTDSRYPVAWLTITAPRGALPTATSTCQCGRNLFATGHRKTLALIEDHTTHRTHCPLLTTEERNAS
ncbi:hypothetical protein PZB75_14670 [Streptomyces sp. AM 4-1-1]|uniref:hypothetical protein n=1 Tax=Streptomyces sp. AM 4-1-1 TaxID=3028710 RepID=UPI0023B93A72|nr:hypothetical protein [Streptomyces sp. AM 4-1-1]WEH34478.1 hypothetical protein PZB75_14670 [Streptomyces sp. AM 4-1-1]